MFQCGYVVFFFFQAEDGIRDIGVTGVQTCALPISAGVMRLLEEADVELSGARAVVLGRSILVGKPMAQLLLAANATVTHCHSRTQDLAAVCREADVLVAAVGSAGLVTGDMVGEGAVVIDVGTNRTDDGLVGDVDFDAAAERAR